MYSQFLPLIAIWIALVAVTSIYFYRRRDLSAGVVLVYIFLLRWNGLQGLIYAFPWYIPLNDPATVYAGFVQSTLGMVSLVIGALVVAPLLQKIHRKIGYRSSFRISRSEPDKPVVSFLLYIAIGLIAYFILGPLFGKLPTVSAFISALQRLLPVGLALGFWETHQARKPNPKMSVFLWGLTGLWPVVTMTTQGFLGFGLLPVIFVFVFVALLSKKPIRIFLLGAAIGYMGISLTVTYLQVRSDIRNAVWGGDDLNTRLNTISSSLSSNFKLLDFTDSDQLRAIDGRFGLNALTGLAVQRVNTGVVPFANGSTILDAALAVIPRAIWPDKPIAVGGQAYVNLYTGVYFLGSTTVAMGQVMEFYVNYGAAGVFIGFMVLGTVLAVIDKSAALALHKGNQHRFSLLVVCAFGLWLNQDNLVTILGTSISGVGTVIIFSLILETLVSLRRHHLSSVAPDRTTPNLEQTSGDARVVG